MLNLRPAATHLNTCCLIFTQPLPFNAEIAHKNTAISSLEAQHDLRQSSPLRSAASLPHWRWQLLIGVWMQVGSGMAVTHQVMPDPHSQTKWTLPKEMLHVCTEGGRGLLTYSRERDGHLIPQLWRQAQTRRSAQKVKLTLEGGGWGGCQDGLRVKSEVYLSWHLSGLQRSNRWN